VHEVRVHLGVAAKKPHSPSSGDRRRSGSAVRQSHRTASQLRNPSPFAVQRRATSKAVQQSQPFWGLAVPAGNGGTGRTSGQADSRIF
tara:strand:+ start:297 stop:560 length:264 start_codon:yes stop_codon:yes gene_type:complete